MGNGELQVDQVLAQQVRQVFRRLHSVLDERIGSVDIGADGHALRTDDHAVSDVRLRGNLARVIVEQQVIETQYRFRTDQRDQVPEGAAALDQLLLVELGGRAQKVKRVGRHGADQDDQDGKAEFRA